MADPTIEASPTSASSSQAFWRRAVGLVWRRATLVGILFFGAFFVLSLYAASRRLNWAGDFRGFWSASYLALRGHPADFWAAFFYPPPFLLLCLPLALLPFAISATAFLLITTGLFALSLRMFAPKLFIGTFMALIYVATWVNMIGMQCGLLIAALLLFGAALMDRRPILAGAFYGALVIKPQFAIVLPFALAASGRWKVLFSTGGTALGLSLLSAAVLGADTWVAFVREPHAVHDWLNAGFEGAKMLSALGAGLALGATASTAYAAQAALTVACCIAAAVTGRRCRDASVLGAMICVYALLASPWTHAYDLAILTGPLAFLSARSDTAWWEKALLLAAFAWPAGWPFLIPLTNLPLTLPLLIGVLAMLARHSQRSAPALVRQY